MINKQNITKIFFFCLLAGALFFGINYLYHIKTERNHYNLVVLMQTIHLGDFKTNVEAIVTQQNNPIFKLHKINEKQWIIETPYEFGATNWLLEIEYNNDKVVALRIRTSDSMKNKPQNAPIDVENTSR